MKSIRKQRGREKEKVVFPVAESLSKMPENYRDFISGLKEQIKRERLKAVLSANSAMIVLYWKIGRAILEKQQDEGWGTKVIDRMSHDLKESFPDMSGFSPRNLKYMRKFAEAWSNFEIVQRTVAQIPWRSNITLLNKLKDPELRLWYAQKTIENGFGKDMLVKSKNKMVVEYSLSGVQNPIGVSNWENGIVRSLPDYLKSSLPPIEEIEKEFENS
jgi:predicted nuclease of restriction endonuclease-like (RecB) superfamily